MRLGETAEKLNSKIDYLCNWFMMHPTPFELSDEDIRNIKDNLWDIKLLSEMVVEKI